MNQEQFMQAVKLATNILVVAILLTVIIAVIVTVFKARSGKDVESRLMPLMVVLALAIVASGIGMFLPQINGFDFGAFIPIVTIIAQLIAIVAMVVALIFTKKR